MNCRVLISSNELWGRGCGVSHESENDLAKMVSDFLENGNSGGTDSRYSSDSDSGLSDLFHLSEKISYFKLVMDQYESDLLSVVITLILSIKERDLHAATSCPCTAASCIRLYLVKLLRLSGYDAGVCTSRWQQTGKVPGGDHEYIDVIRHHNRQSTERLIVDVDFRSHFEIARAVDSYDRILHSLPVIYVGSFTSLKQFLEVMVEAARSSLKLNSMPLPPWRSLAYLQAKWQSPYIRRSNPDEQNLKRTTLTMVEHQCAGHLKRLQSSLVSDIEFGRTLRPNNRDRRVKIERQKPLNYL